MRVSFRPLRLGVAPEAPPAPTKPDTKPETRPDTTPAPKEPAPAVPFPGHEPQREPGPCRRPGPCTVPPPGTP